MAAIGLAAIWPAARISAKTYLTRWSAMGVTRAGAWELLGATQTLQFPGGMRYLKGLFNADWTSLAPARAAGKAMRAKPTSARLQAADFAPAYSRQPKKYRYDMAARVRDPVTGRFVSQRLTIYSNVRLTKQQAQDATEEQFETTYAAKYGVIYLSSSIREAYMT